jgi:hypothetical protein
MVSSPDPILQQAETHLRAGEKNAARAALKQYLSANPRDAAAWQLMSRSVETRPETLFCLRQALRWQPDDPALRLSVERLSTSQPRPAPLAAETLILASEVSPAVLASQPAQRFLLLKILASYLLSAVIVAAYLILLYSRR